MLRRIHLQYAGLLQMLDLEHRLSALYADLLRELVVQRTAYHRGDQGVVVPAADVARLDVLAVTDNRNAVAELEQLFEFMGYKDDADAACLQFTAGLHQLLDLFFAQRRGRLVHNDHFCVDENRLGDLDHLLNICTSCRPAWSGLRPDRERRRLPLRRLLVHGG